MAKRLLLCTAKLQAPALGRVKGCQLRWVGRKLPTAESSHAGDVYQLTYGNWETSFQPPVSHDRFLNPSQCFVGGAAVEEEIMGTSVFL